MRLTKDWKCHKLNGVERTLPAGTAVCNFGFHGDYHLQTVGGPDDGAFFWSRERPEFDNPETWET